MIIYTGNNQTIEVNPDENSYRYRSIRSEDSISLTFSTYMPVEIPLGSYVEFEGKRYELLLPEKFKKNGTRNFEYTLILDGAQNQLKKYKFKDTTTRRLKFSLTAKPHEHLQMLIDNLNLRNSGTIKNWQMGEYIDAVEQVISYNHTTCWDALEAMANTFNTEWEIKESGRIKTIHLKKVEYNRDNPLALSYGRGNGFRPGLGRANYEDKNPVEILYVQGSDRNIDYSKYGARELLLPKNQILRYDGQYFEGEESYDSSQAREYISDSDGFSIQRNHVELKTRTEDSLDCSNIYPSRVGTVTSVIVANEEKNFYDFTDNTIPENLDFTDYIIAGESLTVIFEEGMLAGKEFEVKYKHNDRKFEIVPQEIDGQTMPNEIFKPAAGQKYAVFGMMLPDEYISDDTTQTGASWDMFREAVRYFRDNEEPKFSFTGELDGIWAKKDWLNIGGKIILGGHIFFSDNQFLQEGSLIRIIGIKEYLHKPQSPVIELSNKPVSGGFFSTINKIEENEVVTENYYNQSLQFTKRRFRDSMETMKLLEEALLENFTESISPITVQTMMLLLGDESLQFRFVNNTTNPVEVTHNVTYNQDTKILNTPEGILQHMTLGIDSVASSHQASEYKFWTIPEFNSPPLTDPDKKYYLYARVNRTTATGVFYLSETAISMNSGTTYYYLLMGILNSEYESERSYVSMYGFTEILPGRITTNRIVSTNGTTYFDLVNNEIGGRIKFVEGLISSLVYLQSVSTGQITAGLQGDSAVNVGMWLGGTYQEALNNLAKTILNKDGSFQFLGGLFKGTSDNKLIINLDNFKIYESGLLNITGGICEPFMHINEDNYDEFVSDEGVVNLNKSGFKIRLNYVKESGIYLPYDSKYDGAEITIYNTTGTNFNLSGPVVNRMIDDVNQPLEWINTVSVPIANKRMVKLRCYCFRMTDYPEVSSENNDGTFYVRWIYIENKTF